MFAKCSPPARRAGGQAGIVDAESMEYCSAAENRLVPSRVITGSMSTQYQPELQRVHAVKLEAGKPDKASVCGYKYRTADLDPDRDWLTVMIVARCADCAEVSRRGYRSRALG